MREIKFRAWDKISQSMLCWYELISSQNNLKLWHLKNKTNLEWLQFTGLTDKKGIDIYEGDIIKADWHWENNKIVDLSYEASFFYAIQEYCLEDALEVIGNIYENPELL
jgi:hypothetical protein